MVRTKHLRTKLAILTASSAAVAGGWLGFRLTSPSTDAAGPPPVDVTAAGGVASSSQPASSTGPRTAAPAATPPQAQRPHARTRVS